MEMLPEDYILNWDGVCFACIGDGGDDPYLVLGDSFLRGFYSIHDYSKMRFGFVPHSESTKLAPQKGNVPKKKLEPYQHWKKGAVAMS